MEQTRATITSVGHYLPDDRLTNHDLENLLIRMMSGFELEQVLLSEEY